MGWLDFLRRRRPILSRPVVLSDDEAVTCVRPGGHTESVAWADLAAVLIRTTSGGPFVDDLFWVLVAQGAASGCVVPSEAEGRDRLLNRLQLLPGFDSGAVILAAQCTDDRSFLCWQSQGTNPADLGPS